MTFSEWTNNNVILLFALLLFVLVLGLVLGLKRGGFRRHLPYCFTLLISTQYYFISPLFFYLSGRRYIIGTDISEYYGLGVFFPLVGLIFFVTGYWISDSSRATRRSPQQLDTQKDRFSNKTISILFCVLYGTVVINMAVGGIDVKNIFLGDTTVGLGAKGETYFLQNFADSLISLIFMGFLFRLRSNALGIAIIFSFFLFSLLGFRYRILLTLFGIGFSSLYLYQLRARTVVVGLMVATAFFYLVMVITENRLALIRKEYSSIEMNPVNFDYSNYFEQTRGSLADMTIYKVYDNPNKDVSHDYGSSMFAYIFIRMIPRVIYPDKDEFYPPPQNRVQYIAYDAWWGKLSGEANLSCSTFYIAFGWFGVVFFHFLWGVLLRFAEKRTNFSSKTSLTIYIIIALVSFQWITRPYLPQAVDHAFYLLIPVLVLRFLFKRRIRDRSHNFKSVPANKFTGS